jgi:hypothetical protein
VVIENGLGLDAWADGHRGAFNIIGRRPDRDSRGVEVLGCLRPESIVGRGRAPSASTLRLIGLAPIITQNIDGLARVAPDPGPSSSRKTFLAQLEQRMAQWNKAMEPVRGSKVVVFHPVYIYFLTRFGLNQAAAVEDRPGIPPSPQHVVNLIRQIKEEKTASSWSSQTTSS